MSGMYVSLIWSCLWGMVLFIAGSAIYEFAAAMMLLVGAITFLTFLMYDEVGLRTDT